MKLQLYNVWVHSYHFDINFMGVVNAVLALFTSVTNMTPRYAVHGGTARENLALQNIQVSTYSI
jgi:NAD+ synthase (glutamine-hydrolysing)